MNALAQSAKQNKFTPTTNTSNLLVQRKCACGGASKLGGQCSECEKKKLVGVNASLIQPKLKIGQPNDKYEQEADRVADEVMRMPESNVQRQLDTGEEKETIQRKPIASQITPLVQRQASGEDDEEQVQLKSHVSSGIIQRQEPDAKSKSNEEETKEALKKTAEAFLETAPGKAIVKKGKEVVTTLPGLVITGTAAVGAVTTLIATNKALPIQAPAIPLDIIHPGLSMKITVEGPLRAPTKAMISFSGKFGLPKRQGRQKPAKTESEKLREENTRMQREQFEFREALKTPKEKARDRQMLVHQMSKRLVLPGLKSQEDVPPIEKEKEETAIQRKETNNSAEVGADTSMVRDVTQSAGDRLDVATRGFMEQRFGHDFSQVRIHTNSAASFSARALNAQAYTTGHNIVFTPERYKPQTHAGRKLLAHELTHVVQQSNKGAFDCSDKESQKILVGDYLRFPMIQRAIEFDKTAAQSTLQIIDPETGKESESAPALEAFVHGLWKYLAINVKVENYTITDPQYDTRREEEVAKLFKRHFTPAVEVVKSTNTGITGSDRFVDERKVIDVKEALKTWVDVRTDIYKRIDDFFDTEILTDKTAANLVGTGKGKGDVSINPNYLKNTVISKAVSESFDWFWILLHETRHLKGEEDPHPTSSSDAVIKKERKQALVGQFGDKNRVSLLGEAVSTLNILRTGFGLPLRTNYSDDGIVFFTTEGPIGLAEDRRKKDSETSSNLRQEFKGARFSDNDRPTKASDLTLPDKFIKEDRERQKRLLDKLIVGNGTSFWKGHTTNQKTGLRSPYVVSLKGKSPNITGEYSYETESGGRVKGTISNGVTTTFANVSLNLNWNDTDGADGRGFFTFDGLETLEGLWDFGTDNSVGGLWDLSVS